MESSDEHLVEFTANLDYVELFQETIITHMRILVYFTKSY